MTLRPERTVLEEQRPGFVRYVRSLLPGRGDMDAEDVVQDVLLSVLERNDLPAVEYVAGYVFRALKNRIIDLARTRKNMVSLDSEERGGERLIDLLRETQPDALTRMQSEESRQILFIGLSTLKDIERQVVIAHELEGTSYKELAALTGIPQNTLLSHKARGMKKLRVYFQAEASSATQQENS